MYCQNCAAEIPDGATACPSCGYEAVGTAYVLNGTTEQVNPSYDYESKSSKKTDRNTKKILNAEYKSAKAAYKKARKAAGKSRAPLVILVIILAIALVGCGAFGAYYLMNQKVVSLNARIADLEAQLAKVESDAAQAAEDAAAQEAAEYASVVAAWNQVTFENSTVNGDAENVCTNGEQNASSVSILMKDFNSTEATANITVLFHGHEGQAVAASSPSASAAASSSTGTNAASSSPAASSQPSSETSSSLAASANDKMHTFVDVQGTVEDGVITFTIDGTTADAAGVALGEGSQIVVKCTLNPTLSSMDVAVQSFYNSTTDYIQDAYTITKSE